MLIFKIHKLLQTIDELMHILDIMMHPVEKFMQVMRYVDAAFFPSDAG